MFVNCARNKLTHKDSMTLISIFAKIIESSKSTTLETGTSGGRGEMKDEGWVEVRDRSVSSGGSKSLTIP